LLSFFPKKKKKLNSFSTSSFLVPQEKKKERKNSLSFSSSAVVGIFFRDKQLSSNRPTSPLLLPKSNQQEKQIFEMQIQKKNIKNHLSPFFFFTR